jgi:hypothetical protein
MKFEEKGFSYLHSYPFRNPKPSQIAQSPIKIRPKKPLNTHKKLQSKTRGMVMAANQGPPIAGRKVGIHRRKATITIYSRKGRTSPRLLAC